MEQFGSSNVRGWINTGLRYQGEPVFLDDRSGEMARESLQDGKLIALPASVEHSLRLLAAEGFRVKVSDTDA